VTRSDQAVLVVNCGSSSLKYRLLYPAAGEVVAQGHVDPIGGPGAAVHRVGGDSFERPIAALDHAGALEAMLAGFAEHGPDLAGDDAPAAIGHRVVHGGDRFTTATVVDGEVLTAIDALSALAPLHNPAAAAGIRVARARLPGVPHVAVFDTAFHATIPAVAATYAVPKAWRSEYGVRRYGFHGSSHAYVSRRVAELLGRPLGSVNTIVLHLGNGASACAVAGGRSIDTSMGMTPLAGLVMGTRSGDLDPAVPEYLQRVAGLDAAGVDDALNHASGLAGLAGTGDLREVTERAQAGDAQARLALDVYCYRIRGYVGAYVAALGRLDAIAFTAGVGENSALVRAGSLAGLDGLGVCVDEDRNRSGAHEARRISPDDAPVAVLVVPTDEEREIATQALAVVEGGPTTDRPR
jgi:acetate kinase